MYVEYSGQALLFGVYLKKPDYAKKCVDSLGADFILCHDYVLFEINCVISSLLVSLVELDIKGYAFDQYEISSKNVDHYHKYVF